MEILEYLSLIPDKLYVITLMFTRKIVCMVLKEVSYQSASLTPFETIKFTIFYVI